MNNPKKALAYLMKRQRAEENIKELQSQITKLQFEKRSLAQKVGEYQRQMDKALMEYGKTTKGKINGAILE